MNTHRKTGIRIDNNWFRGEKYIQKTSKLAFAIYTLILERVGCNNRSYFNINYLITQLGMNKKNGHMSERIKSALASLEEHDIITFHEDIFSDDVILFDEQTTTKNTELYVSVIEPIEKYTIIYADELFTVLLSDYEDYHARVGMLSQFCYIISCINKVHNVCFPSMANIMECSTVGSYHILKEHLNKLVELEVLVFKNPNIMINGSGLSQTPNHYARPIHESELNVIVEEKASKLKNKPMTTTTMELGNLKRSLTQKTNYIRTKKEAGSDTEEDIKRLNEMLEEYNQLCASTGQKPTFNMDAQPKKAVISTKGANGFHVNSETQEIHIDYGCDPFDDSSDITPYL